MNDSIRKLAELKIKLVEATDFYEVFHYFYDHFGDSDEFINSGAPRHNKRLQQALVTCLKAVLTHRRLMKCQLIMVYIKEHKFYHGSGHCDEALVNFFYFADIDAGLVAVAAKELEHGTVTMRFAMENVGEPPVPPKN